MHEKYGVVVVVVVVEVVGTVVSYWFNESGTIVVMYWSYES